MQQISVTELKAVLQHLSKNVALLGQGPKTQDLVQSIETLQKEVAESKATNARALNQLGHQQV